MMKNVCSHIYTLIRDCVKLLISRQESFVGLPKILNCVISMLRISAKTKKWQKQKWVGLPAVPRWLSAVVAQALL